MHRIVTFGAVTLFCSQILALQQPPVYRGGVDLVADAERQMGVAA